MFQVLFAALLLSSSAIFTVCSAVQTAAAPTSNLPNPASVFCEQNGGKVELRQDASGGVTGACQFADGSKCDEWAFFRGECKPGGAQAAVLPTGTGTPSSGPATATPDVGADGWKVYRNSELGYVFHYPSNAAISLADDPERTLTIRGPLSGNANWPTIFFSHPRDREAYRPPEGVDLENWLTDHNILSANGKSGEIRQPNTQIAGVEAIHTRSARSPQTYAYDKYYFARSQQLYSVIILHTGDKEDWTLYNHLLGSIQFER